MFFKKPKLYRSLNDYFSEPEETISKKRNDAQTCIPYEATKAKKPIPVFFLRLLLALLLFLGGVYTQKHPFEFCGISSKQIDEHIKDDHFVKELETMVSELLKQD